MSAKEKAILDYLKQFAKDTVLEANSVSIQFDFKHEAYQFNELLQSYLKDNRKSK